MARKIIGVSFILLASLIIVSLVMEMEVFSRAKGKVIPYHSIVNADFSEPGSLDKIYVKEGQVVAKGELIAELDHREYRLNLAILNSKKQMIESKLSLLRAVLMAEEVEVPADVSVYSQRSEHFRKLKENHASSMQNFNDLVAVNDAKVNSIETLISQKAAAPLSVLDSKQRAYKDKKDLHKEKREFEEKIIFEIERYSEMQKEVESNIALYEYYLEKSYLYSPVGGVIRDIYFKQEGKYVKKGETFVDIIEASDVPYKVRLRVAADEIGLINQGAMVTIRVDTYSHSVFGTLSGKINRISLDTIVEKDNQNFYLVDVIPEKNYLLKGERQYPLKYGMTLYATIQRGNVSVFSYYMKPIIRSFHEIGTL